mgnify:CR=1 FL=1
MEPDATTSDGGGTSDERQCRAYCAPRSSDNGTLKRCTRRPKHGGLFCGTHSTCQPNGFVSDTIQNSPLERVDVRLQCIRGIYFHVDAHSNVYHTNDIMNGVVDPRIVGTYFLDDMAQAGGCLPDRRHSPHAHAVPEGAEGEKRDAGPKALAACACGPGGRKEGLGEGRHVQGTEPPYAVHIFECADHTEHP